MNIPEWVEKKKEVLILLGMALLLGLLVYLGMRMNHTYLKSDKEVEKPPERVRFDQKKSPESEGEREKKKPVASYFLKPSPAEVMSMVKEIVDSELPVPKEKYNNLRIVWPVYFFRVLEQNGALVTVQFDTSEDGFGINVLTDIDSSVYPEILSAPEFRKVWLAGEITAIDATGTGTIYMNTEHVRFREELEEVKRVEQKEKK